MAGYVADFACAEARLLIEIDGVVHDMGDRPARDDRRSLILENLGWQVVRVAARRVLADPSTVAEAVLRMAESKRPLHHSR